MLKPLSRKRRKQYVACQGTVCPYCGSTDLHPSIRWDVDRGVASLGVACGACGICWRAVYALSDVVGCGADVARRPCSRDPGVPWVRSSCVPLHILI
jgi:hypothetical protein